MSDRPIQVVLDASAIVAYIRGSIDVGETIAEVSSEGASIALPVLSLIEANRAAVDREWLDHLLDHDAVTILDVKGSGWLALAMMHDLVDPLDSASAALATIDFRCPVLTARPRQYAGSMAAEWVIEVSPG